MEINNSLTILYVEDDLLARDAVVVLLQEFYRNIIIAEDGIEALALYNEHPIDLVITDIGLPHLDGIELTKQLKKRNSDLNIIITSAYSDKEYLLESIKSGITDYFIKPLQIDEILRIINTVAQKIEQKKREERETNLLHYYKEAADQSSMIAHVDTDGKISYVNDSFSKVTEYSEEELLGEIYYVGDHRDKSKNIFLRLLASIKENQTSWQGVIRNRTKNQQNYYAKTTITPIIKDNTIQEFILFQTLITDIIHPKRQFLDYIELLEHVYIALIKIENFKYFEHSVFGRLNEGLEQSFADQIFSRLPEACAFSQIYILGNGEFALVQSIADLPQSAEHITRQLHQYQEIINHEEIKLDGVDYEFSILMSIAHGKNAFEDAKIGLHYLVDSTKNFIVANGLKVEKDQQVEQLKFLKKAIENYNVISYFQPIVNNRTRKVEKYESLVRFIDEEQNVLSPYLFLELSKQGKYYDQITSIVLENSFKALEKTDMNIAINFSALDLEKPSTQEQFIALICDNQEKADRIILELTEDEDIEDFDTIKSFIHAIKQFGVRVAIDDFGTGYSNFERVLDYEPNILKIDGKLISNMKKDNLAYSIVEFIVNFAKKENLLTIAEYVETKETYELLCQMGVDYSQGYYFGKPDKL